MTDVFKLGALELIDGKPFKIANDIERKTIIQVGRELAGLPTERKGQITFASYVDKKMLKGRRFTINGSAGGAVTNCRWTTRHKDTWYWKECLD